MKKNNQEIIYCYIFNTYTNSIKEDRFAVISGGPKYNDLIVLKSLSDSTIKKTLGRWMIDKERIDESGAPKELSIYFSRRCKSIKILNPLFEEYYEEKIANCENNIKDIKQDLVDEEDFKDYLNAICSGLKDTKFIGFSEPSEEIERD